MHFLLLALIDVLLLARVTWAQVPTPSPGNSSAESAFQEYVDLAHGVSFRYPGSWHLNQGGGAYLPPVILKNSADPTAPYKPTAYVALLGRDAKQGPYANSNFINAWFLYRIAQDLNQEQCYAQASAPLQDSNESDSWKLGWSTIDGVRFRRGTGTDQGLCNETTQDFYAAFHAGRCYLFEKQVNTVCPHSDGLRDLTPRELNGISQQLDSVMLSVRFAGAPPPKLSLALTNYDPFVQNLTSPARDIRGSSAQTARTVQVHVPQRLKIVRSPSKVTVAIDRNSLEPAQLMVNRNLAIGVMQALRVCPANAPRPSSPDRIGVSSGTDFNLGTDILNAKDRNFPVPGKPFVIEMDLTVFETPVPPQHTWPLIIGTNYRILWQRVMKVIID
jgi:hypothetical protein